MATLLLLSLSLAPLLGGLISGKKEAYTYLPQSLLDFPSSRRIKQIMEEVGLEEVHIHYLALGVVAIHIGTKGEATAEHWGGRC